MMIQEVVNDPEWQALRRSFIGTWRNNKDKNCIKLRQYLGDFSDPLRLRRVHNYLTGTGFRIGKIQSPEISELLNEVKNKRNV